MGRNIKILLVTILCAYLLINSKISGNEVSEETNTHEFAEVIDHKEETALAVDEKVVEDNQATDNTIYEWNDQIRDWVEVEDASKAKAALTSEPVETHASSAPVTIDWKTLMDIKYELKYFSAIETEAYAPIFPGTIKALDKKEVIIEGFVIPFDEEGEFLALSFNPYASCFFCGKASPASVMSMRLKNKRKRYKIDDFKKFKGTLYLNSNDPNEFYYILADAKEVK